MSLYMPDPNEKIGYVLVPHDGSVKNLQTILIKMNITHDLNNEKSVKAELSVSQKITLEKWATII